MSPRTRIITLNLGSQCIELAEFRGRSASELTLCAYRVRELLADPAKESARQAQVDTALREMLAEMQINNGPVNYTVAEESTFTRFVRMPMACEGKIEQIIAFEAQQNVPFPLEEVVWDYQVVSGDTGQQIEAILVAIKADLLDELNNAVEATGLRTSVVDLATMALYNAFRHNYSDVTGCALLLDIGARTTNLLFIEAEKIFTRSVAIGGSTATCAIAREFNESFAAAEFRKKRDGSVGHVVGESDVARVSRIMSGTVMRLHAELVRSINHYCTQQQGKAPECVFLSGGGAGTPHLREFFREKLAVPVEFFDPLRTVSLAESADAIEIERSRHLLGEPVGLALRAVSDCPMALNLLPCSVVRRRSMEKRRPFLVGAAICCVLALLGWDVYFKCATRVLRYRTEQMDEKVAALKRIESQLNEERRRTAAIDDLAAPLVAAINDRNFWPQIIEELNARLPKEDIWITDLVATSKGMPFDSADPRALRGEVSTLPRPASPTGTKLAEPAIDGLLVRGLYLFNPKQQEVVIDYFRNLAGSPLFAIDPNNQSSVVKPTTPNDTEWAFPYELRLDLTKPVKFP